MSTFLKLNGISKSFGEINAFRDVSLEVDEDELLVILGPTGAGKTTLLRTIVGLEEPDAGSIEMAGEDITAMATAHRDMALVFQNFSLYPSWSVRKNLEFPLRAPGRMIGREEINERVAWAADILKITRLLDRKAVQLSGGEMQRVAIGRAIVRHPKMFLMDEPLTNLDAKLREALRVELVVLRRKLKIPMVYVTHDQSEALSMGDRVVVLSEGAVLQTGTPQQVYSQPATPEVARQLGQPPINIIPVTADNGFWQGKDGTPLMPCATGDGQKLLGIRPEDVLPEGGDVEATIRVVEETGPEKILLVDWAGSDFHILTRRHTQLHPGDKIYPSINPDKAVIWDQP